MAQDEIPIPELTPLDKLQAISNRHVDNSSPLEFSPRGRFNFPTREFVKPVELLPTPLDPTREIESLYDYFDGVYLISLSRRPDRLAEFEKRFPKDWPMKPYVVVPGVDGTRVPKPGYFTGPKGAFGCLRSHVQILERAMSEGCRRALIMEDDCLWKPNYIEQLALGISEIPSNYEVWFIGGQANPASKPQMVGKCLMQPTERPGIHRTHCYAVQREGMEQLYHLWTNPQHGKTHCDVVAGRWMIGRLVYGSHPFIAGQGANKSDIASSSRAFNDRFFD